MDGQDTMNKPQKTPLVAVVIINWNGRRWLPRAWTPCWPLNTTMFKSMSDAGLRSEAGGDD